VSEKEIADYFDATVAAVGGDAQGKKVANWLINEVLARATDPRVLAEKDVPVAPAALGALVALVEKGSLSGKQAKDVFARMWQERRSAADIVAAEGLTQVSDAGEIEAICRSVVDGHPAEVARFRGGEAKLIGFFVGQVIKASGGKANPKTVNELLRKLLT
ncbi:MAG TPA: Asp-tRNA(Asn)/Glu-tRNA(Gln) amidotransferase GatCAB subunit B, partial [Polyangia bacterium]